MYFLIAELTRIPWAMSAGAGFASAELSRALVAPSPAYSIVSVEGVPGSQSHGLPDREHSPSHSHLLGRSPQCGLEQTSLWELF